MIVRGGVPVWLLIVTGCGGPDGLVLDLAPELVSSLDGATVLTARAYRGGSPVAGVELAVDVAYTDRNGVEHEVAADGGVTDARGELRLPLGGLAWEGVGTVTVAGDGVEGRIDFVVLDESPPTVEVRPPNGDGRVGRGLPIEVEVVVDDEIGVAELTLEADGEVRSSTTAIVPAGASSVWLRLDVPPSAAAGPSITLRAVATDLSGNRAVAEPVGLTVDPDVVFATTGGLTARYAYLSGYEGLGGLAGVAVSPRDGDLYLPDYSPQMGPCSGCVRRVDGEAGTLTSEVVHDYVASMGPALAFDAGGDALWLVDGEQVLRLAWEDSVGRYTSPETCNVPDTDAPKDARGLVLDDELGALITDPGTDRVLRLADCDGTAAEAFVSYLEDPWAIVAGDGGFFVSLPGDDEVVRVGRDGAVTPFEDFGLDQPRALAWVEGGESPFADSLLVADYGSRRIVATRGDGTTRTAVHLARRPLAMTQVAGVLYVALDAEAEWAGRVVAIAGF